MKSRRFVFGKDKKIAKLELNVRNSEQFRDRDRAKVAYLKIANLANIGANILQKRSQNILN
jgi:hypothetical protein